MKPAPVTVVITTYNRRDLVRDAILAHGHDGLILRRADLDHRNQFVDVVVVLLVNTIRIIAD